MTIIKTSDATPLQLNWAVARCKGIELEGGKYNRLLVDGRMSRGQEMLVPYNPSTNWAQGGPIIERECIDIEYFPGDAVWQAQACLQDEYCTQYGLTPLIAAMRCFVASRLGDEVDVPEELQ